MAEAAVERAKAWERFDALTDACVSEVAGATEAAKRRRFNAFAKEADADFERQAIISARRTGLQGSGLEVEDVKLMYIGWAWHYLFTRQCRNGAVGFTTAPVLNEKGELTRWRGSAGLYCRMKTRRKVEKEINKVKRLRDGKNRRGAGAPEYLTSKGELPDVVSDRAPMAHAEGCMDAVRIAMRRVCKTVQDFVILDALVKAEGEADYCVTIMVTQGGFETRRKAQTALKEFRERMTARLARAA